MHILLTAVSVIGKILLAVLILLILIVLLLLFAPVRYQAGVRRKTQTPFSELEILFGIRYLAGIIRVAGKWKGGTWGAALKLFGRDLRIIGDERVFGRETEVGAALEELPDDPPENRTEKEPEKKPDEPEKEPEKKPDEPAKEPERKPDEPAKEPERKQVEPAEAADDNKGEPLRKKAQRRIKKDRRSGSGKKPSKAGKMISSAAEAISRIMSRLIDLITSLPDLLWKLPDSWDAIDDKIYGLKKEIRPWLAGCSKEAYRAILHQLMTLLSHYRVRKAKGHLTFGTGDPAMTGAAGGVIRSVLPAGASHFELQPVFHDRMLDADMMLEGHIRLCHLVKAVVVLLLNKNIRKMIRRLRRMHGGK